MVLLKVLFICVCVYLLFDTRECLIFLIASISNWRRRDQRVRTGAALNLFPEQSHSAFQLQERERTRKANLFDFHSARFSLTQFFTHPNFLLAQFYSLKSIWQPSNRVSISGEKKLKFQIYLLQIGFRLAMAVRMEKASDSVLIQFAGKFSRALRGPDTVHCSRGQNMSPSLCRSFPLSCGS